MIAGPRGLRSPRSTAHDNHPDVLSSERMSALHQNAANQEFGMPLMASRRSRCPILPDLDERGDVSTVGDSGAPGLKRRLTWLVNVGEGHLLCGCRDQLAAAQNKTLDGPRYVNDWRAPRSPLQQSFKARKFSRDGLENRRSETRLPLARSAWLGARQPGRQSPTARYQFPV